MADRNAGAVVRILAKAQPSLGVVDAAQTVINSTAGQLLADTPGRNGLFIQNTGLTTIKLLCGTDTPTQSVYHVALKACAVANDGTGGIYMDDAYTGPIQAISSADGGTCVIFEIIEG